MRIKKKHITAIAALIFAIAGIIWGDDVYTSVETPFMASPSHAEETASADTISRVVDGDTIKVMISGEEETVRIIGINTPETVDPRKPVECLGVEASDTLKAMLGEGTAVTLTPDPTQDEADRYGRLLRYVANESGQDVGLQLITQGYAYEYTYRTPYERQREYQEAQHSAREEERGLWDATKCP